MLFTSKINVTSLQNTILAREHRGDLSTRSFKDENYFRILEVNRTVFCLRLFRSEICLYKEHKFNKMSLLISKH